MASQTAASIGARLREARDRRGWTRREMAREMDGLATENDIYRWETGKHRPRDDALSAAAKALGQPLAWFLGPGMGSTPDPFPDGPDQMSRIEQTLAELLTSVAELREAVAALSPPQQQPPEDRRQRPAA